MMIKYLCPEIGTFYLFLPVLNSTAHNKVKTPEIGHAHRRGFDSRDVPWYISRSITPRLTRLFTSPSHWLRRLAGQMTNVPPFSSVEKYMTYQNKP
jgi:hypothetical protein